MVGPPRNGLSPRCISTPGRYRGILRLASAPASSRCAMTRPLCPRLLLLAAACWACGQASLQQAPAAEANAAFQAALESIRDDQVEGYVTHLADGKFEVAGGHAGRAFRRRHLVEQPANCNSKPAERMAAPPALADGYRNVIASQRPDRAGHQTLIVCAHYDHIGRGSRRQASARSGRFTTPDDNASGVAACWKSPGF